MPTMIILYRFGYRIETYKDEIVARDDFRKHCANGQVVHVCLYGADGAIIMQSDVRQIS